MEIYIDDLKLNNDNFESPQYHSTGTYEWEKGKGMTFGSALLSTGKYDIIPANKDSLIKLFFNNYQPNIVNIVIKESKDDEDPIISSYELDEMMDRIYKNNNSQYSDEEKRIRKVINTLEKQKQKIDEEIFKLKSQLEYVGTLNRLDKYSYTFALPRKIQPGIYKCEGYIKWDSDEYKSDSRLSFKIKI
jgi:hypothetical protein